MKAIFRSIAIVMALAVAITMSIFLVSTAPVAASLAGCSAKASHNSVAASSSEQAAQSQTIHLAAVAFAKPGKPAITALTDSSTSIVIEWNKVKRAKGYQIYRKLGTAGTYKKVKTIKSSGTRYWKDTKVTDIGIEYYYKVRAYSKVRSKNVYGSFSKSDYALATDKPFYYAGFLFQGDRYEEPVIGVEVDNYTTHPMTIDDFGLFVMDYTAFVENDEDTYNVCYLDADTTIEAGCYDYLYYDQGDYVVDFDDYYSVMIAGMYYRGHEYDFDINNHADSTPTIVTSPSRSAAMKSRALSLYKTSSHAGAAAGSAVKSRAK